jgi:K+-sensing histidine kinase KdpD
MIVAATPPPASDHDLHSTENHVAACLNLSHELRTPANAILGHVELLLSGAAGPISVDMRTSLGEIQKAALALREQLGTVIHLAENVPMPTAPRAVDGPAGKE